MKEPTKEPTKQRKLEGFLFKERIKRLNMTLAQFAKICRVRRATISYICNGRTWPKGVPEWAEETLAELEELAKGKK